MNSKRIGNIGEAFVLARFVELGIPIYQQFGDNEPADYIIIFNNNPLKIQVKSSETYNGETTVFSLTSSTVHRKNGEKHMYSKEEVDYFVCYDIKTKNIFIIKNNGNMTSIIVRYVKPKNNQAKNINYYENYLLTMDNMNNICIAG